MRHREGPESNHRDTALCSPPDAALVCGPRLHWFRRDAERSGHGGPPPRHPVGGPCGRFGADVSPAAARTEPRPPGMLGAGGDVVCMGTVSPLIRAIAHLLPLGGEGHDPSQRASRGGGSGRRLTARTEPRPPAALVCGPRLHWFRMDAERSGHGGPPPRHPVGGPCGRFGADVSPAAARTEPRPPGMLGAGGDVVCMGTVSPLIRAIAHLLPLGGEGHDPSQRASRGGGSGRRLTARTEPRPPAALVCGPRLRWFRRDAERSGHGGLPPRHPVGGPCGRFGAEARLAVARTEPRPSGMFHLGRNAVSGGAGRPPHPAVGHLLPLGGEGPDECQRARPRVG